LEYETTNDFFNCYTPDCGRFTFEDAVESVFRCPNCGNTLKHYDNSALINALKSRIEILEKESKQPAS
jgi:transcription initiation factor TFIIE subunit alpha